MTADHEHNFIAIDRTHHVESLASVGEREAKKKREKKRKKHRQAESKEPELFEKKSQQHEEFEENSNDEHIDFRA
jgi:hypothetical protein